MDEFAYYNSQNEQKNEFIFQNVQHVWVPDQNNGSYPNGQVLFDLASLSNSGKFLSFAESILVVPLVVTTVCTASTASSAENAFLTSLKNGYHQLINSMSVEITNAQVVSLTNFSNLDINYRLLTTCSVEDERNFLPSINFHKDTAESIMYAGATDAIGVGEYNNVIKQSLFTSATGWGKTGWNFNSGRLQRMMNTSFDPINSMYGSGGAKLVNENATKATGKNYYTSAGTNTDNVHYILATIPLKIIHDLFRKMPLVKGAYVRLIVNLNTQCQSVVTIASSKYTTYTTTSLNQTFPLMLSPIGTGEGFVQSGATSVTMGIGIAKSHNTSTSYTHPVSTCRLYCKVAEMTPTAEEAYLSAVPTKTILYNDILSYQSLSIASGSNVSQILTNGVSRPRYLLIVPQLAGTINGSATGNLTTSYSAGVGQLGTPMNSPFSSSPGTTASQASITNLNLLVSGQTIYQSNYMYGFEEFLQEVRGSNALNGGISLGLSSGLLSQNDWENGYRFCYVDLSRRVSQPNDDISRSIQVIFTNTANVAMDYFYIIGYEKQLTLSTSTGSLII